MRCGDVKTPRKWTRGCGKGEHREARAAGRTAATFNEWREYEITQVAVTWLLACVFVRFFEDNELLDHPWISGPGPQLREARDQHDLFFAEHPTDTGRESGKRFVSLNEECPVKKRNYRQRIAFLFWPYASQFRPTRDSRTLGSMVPTLR